MMIAPAALYLTEDDDLVAEGDPKARWLFCGKGTTLDADQIAKVAAHAGVTIDEFKDAFTRAASESEKPSEPDPTEAPMETQIGEPAEPKALKAKKPKS